MTRLFANPYNIEFNGFYFETVEEYNDKAKAIPTEEYEIIVCYHGYGFDFDKNRPDNIEVDIYEVDRMKDLAE